MSGHLLKVVRERLPMTQEQLAERLGLDKATVQGWESGRRPLSATRAGNLFQLRRTLLRCGADPALLVLLDQALEADAVLAYVVSAPPSTGVVAEHPLAGWVFTRTATHMLAWSLIGRPPAALPPPLPGTPRRRGPAPAAPLLPPAQRSAFFAHLRRAAELAQHAGDPGALLRRQALYLCSYDPAPDTPAWLAELRRTGPRHGRSWTPHWADARSVATAVTRHGDRTPLHRFIADLDDAAETANLNYWAYWLGLDPLPRPDDTFMVERSPRWDAHALLRRLADRLDPSYGCVDLNVHSVWALIGSRPGLLGTDRALDAELRQRVSTLLDGRAISPQSRRELESVHYGLRLSSR